MIEYEVPPEDGIDDDDDDNGKDDGNNADNEYEYKYEYKYKCMYTNTKFNTEEDKLIENNILWSVWNCWTPAGDRMNLNRLQQTS